MGLTLGMGIGHRIFVGDIPVKMSKIVRDDHFVLEVDDHAFDITGNRSIEIMPDVTVYAGNTAIRPAEVQVVFTAPRAIRILRETVYWREKFDRIAEGLEIPDYAVRAARRLGLSGGNDQVRYELAKLVKFSARYTHPTMNLRHEDWVFLVAEGMLEGVGQLVEEPNKFRLDRQVKVLCQECLSDGDPCETCGDAGYMLAWPEDLRPASILYERKSPLA